MTNGPKIDYLYKQISSLIDQSLAIEVRNFIQNLSYNKSQNTVLSYLYDIKKGLAFFAKNGTISLDCVKNLSLIQFRSFCSECRNSNLSTTSQQRLIISWKVFLNFLGINILQKFRMPKTPHRHPKPLSEEEVKLIYSLPINPTWLDYRNRAMWCLMYGTGLRISESLSIREKEVSDFIKIVGKGKKSRLVALVPYVLECIKEYLQIKPYQSEFLFIGCKQEKLSQQTASHIFRAWRDKAGLPKYLTLHSLRHSFATHMLKNNCPLNVVQKLLGHSDMSRTMQYLSISSDQLANSYHNYMGNCID